MPQFRIRAKAHPDEVSVAIADGGTTANVLPPGFERGDSDPRDLRLATALHVAGALAGRLGTDVALIDNNADNIFYIEDEAEEDDLVFIPSN
jgi:hypothetical protein